VTVWPFGLASRNSRHLPARGSSRPSLSLPAPTVLPTEVVEAAQADEDGVGERAPEGLKLGRVSVRAGDRDRDEGGLDRLLSGVALDREPIAVHRHGSAGPRQHRDGRPPGGVDGGGELEVARRAGLVRVRVDDHPVAAGGGEGDVLAGDAVPSERGVGVVECIGTLADDDQIDAGVRAGAGAVPRERLTGGEHDLEADLGRSAGLHGALRLKAVEAVLLRRGDRRRRRARAGAAATPDNGDHTGREQRSAEDAPHRLSTIAGHGLGPVPSGLRWWRVAAIGRRSAPAVARRRGEVAT